MIALIQRVAWAHVSVARAEQLQRIGEIGPGLLALIGIEADDNETRLDKLLHRLLRYRVFADDAGKMNRSLQETRGGLLLVSQFTLVADTESGLRPSFSRGAPPSLGRELFEKLVCRAQSTHSSVASGEFAADMKVELLNDGPVTFLLRS